MQGLIHKVYDSPGCNYKEELFMREYYKHSKKKVKFWSQQAKQETDIPNNRRTNNNSMTIPTTD